MSIPGTSPASISADVDLICPECGYDLRGIESGRCPECGQELDRDKLRRSSIPWSYRHEIGTWKAYWRTVEMVIRRPGLVAADVTRSVSLEDAQKFRRVTAFVAASVPIALLLFAYVKALDLLSGPPIVSAMFFNPSSADPNPPLPAWYTLGWFLEFAVVLIIAASVWLFFFAVSGVASYFFHPAGLPVVRQNRAVALSHYACAPLAITPLTALLAAAFCAAQIYDWFNRKSMAFILAALTSVMIVALIVQSLATIAAPLRLLVRTTRCSGLRVLAMAIALPICWTVLGAIVLIGIPAAAAFIALVVLSFAP